MSRVKTVLVMLALTCVGAAPARGDVLFGTFGPSDSFSTGAGWFVTGPDSFWGAAYQSAQTFTPSVTGTVDQVRFAIGLDFEGPGANQVVFRLMTDDNGLPGSLLESYLFGDEMGFFGEPDQPVLVAGSQSHPLLVAGTRYWMVGVAEQTARRAVRGDVRAQITVGEQSFSPELVCELG